MNRINRRILVLQVLTLMFLATTVAIAWDDVLASPTSPDPAGMVLADDGVLILAIDFDGEVVSIQEVACDEPEADPFCLDQAEARGAFGGSQR